MRSQPLTTDQYLSLLADMPEAERQKLGSLDLYHGIHPEHGHITLAVSLGQDAALITK